MAKGGAKFRLVGGGRKTIMATNKIMKQHRIALQMGIAAAMTKTRVLASYYIIPNYTGTVHPYYAAKKQPPTPGRLTSRTGKLKFMVGHLANPYSPLRHWHGFGKKLVKERSVALMGQVKVISLSKTSDKYVGTYRVNIKSGHSRLFDIKRGKPLETLRTLAVRFNWETGIRGERRPIFEPISKRMHYEMRKFIKQKDKLIRGVI